jgi:hypothetical protein
MALGGLWCRPSVDETILYHQHLQGSATTARTMETTRARLEAGARAESAVGGLAVKSLMPSDAPCSPGPLAVISCSPACLDKYLVDRVVDT